ncbi:MAG: hypothetical protein ACI85O_000936 [Saprospiraceae bacterium]|jgi:hypothetical protein
MVSYSFALTGVKVEGEVKSEVIRVHINQWHELFFTLLPHFAGHSRNFDFDRKEVLTEEELTILAKIYYDKYAVSVSEGYADAIEPNLENPYTWKRIFSKIEKRYFEIEEEKLLKELQDSEDCKSKALEIFKTGWYDRARFTQIQQTLEVCIENKLNVGFAVQDG